MANGMPLPGGGRVAALLAGMPKPPASGPPPGPGDEDEGGETCHISAEQLKELNETGTTQSDDGETITADIGGGSADDATSGGPDPMGSADSGEMGS